MAKNIDLPEIPIGPDIDPKLVTALRQMSANMSRISEFFKRDLVSFTATNGEQTLGHGLGKVPTEIVVTSRTGSGIVYATTAQKTKWTKEKVVLTTTDTSDYTIEVR